MSLFVWVRLGTFPSSGYVCLLRERVLFEKPCEFAFMHFEASHDFSDWLLKVVIITNLGQRQKSA